MKNILKNKITVCIFAVIAVLLLSCAFMLASKTTANADAEETHDHSTMTAINSYADIENGELTAGAYYLGDNINGNITVTGEVTLCLNGKTVTGSGNGSVITVSGGATLTLCDCQETGIITGGTGNERRYCKSGGGVYVDGTFIMAGGTISGNTATEYGGGGGVFVSENGAFKMSGGTISGNTATYGGGVSFCDENVYGDAIDSDINGTFEMTGGTISGNTASQYGGGVSFYGNGTFEMSGGTISGNTARYGGGVFIYSSDEMKSKGTFIMTGGTISGNTASLGGGVCIPVPWVEGGESLSLTASSYAAGDSDGDYVAFIMAGGTISENTATQDGGGVFVGGVEDGCFEMTGGTITGNTAQGYGGGVCVGGKFKVSGTPNITGNKVNGVNDNVSMDLYTTITVTDTLTEGAQMGVTLADGFSGAFTSGYGENNKVGDNIIAPYTYFVSDKDGYFPTLENGEVILGTGVATVTVENVETVYGSIEAAWTYANNATTAATVKMYADSETTDTLTVAEGKDITLNLNGHMLKYSNDTETGSVITVEGTFTLCDSQETGIITGGTGNIDAEVSSYTNGGGVFVSEGGTFIMTGGTISGNTAIYGGGGVFVDKNGTFQMFGGAIDLNTAEISGGGVYVEGEFTMTGGTISGNTLTSDFSTGGGVFLISQTDEDGEIVTGSTMTMTGGNISGNTAQLGGGVVILGTFIMEDGAINDNTADYGAGGVLLLFGTFEMSGGEISGNVQTGDMGLGYCGGVCVGHEMFSDEDIVSFKISGAVNITGNKATIDETQVENNVCLFNDNKITVAGELTEGAKIGVSNSGAVATGFTQNDKPSKYFISDNPENNCIYLSDETDVTIGTHDLVQHEAQQPTCTQTGLTASTSCSVCNTVLQEQTTVDALGHNYGEWTVTKEATESEEGEKRRICANDNTHYETRNLPKLTPTTPENPPEEDPPAKPFETPTAPDPEQKSYVWICWLLIPLIFAIAGVILGIWLYKKNKDN